MDAALFLTSDELDSAFQAREFVALFQPTVSLERLRPVSAEATLQWHHPSLGVLEEPVFVPYAEGQGRRRELTLFALRSAARACAEWHRGGLDWSVTVRVAPTEFLDGDLVAAISVILHECALNPAHLTIEIREAECAGLASQLLPALTELRTFGCGLALRTGAALTMVQEIRNLPLTELTITGGATLQFIQRTRQAQYGVFAQRLADAHANNTCVTAAGVEDEATLWAIQRAGFTAATGSYICRPLPAQGLLRWNKIWLDAAEAIAASKRASQAVADEAAAQPARSGRRILPDPMPAAPPVQSESSPVDAYFEPLPEDEAPIETSADSAMFATLMAEPEAPPPAFLYRDTAVFADEVEATFVSEPEAEADLEAEPQSEPAPEPEAEVTEDELSPAWHDEEFGAPVSETTETAWAEEPAEPEMFEAPRLALPEEIDEELEIQAHEPEALEPVAPEAEAPESEAPEPEAPEPEAPEPVATPPRVDLSQWITTRSSAKLAHNPLDDYFDGPTYTPPPAEPPPVPASEMQEPYGADSVEAELEAFASEDVELEPTSNDAVEEVAATDEAMALPLEENLDAETEFFRDQVEPLAVDVEPEAQAEVEAEGEAELEREAELEAEVDPEAQAAIEVDVEDEPAIAVDLDDESELPPIEIVPEEPPRVRPERLLEPAPAVTVTSPLSTPTNEAGEPVLIARKLPGLDKPITMTVQNPGREGLSLRALFKKRSGK